VTANSPGMPEWGTVRCIEPSPTEPGAAYVVAEAHRLNDFKPYVWKTTDFGKTWTNLAEKLAQDVYLHVVRCDPAKKGLVFVGTERGVAYSTDDGATWQPLRSNLPTVAVHDLVVKGNDLVAGTMGRSIWILDDFGPLRNLTDAVKEKPLHVFPASPVTRWRMAGGFSFDDIGAMPNPRHGVVLHYHIGKKPSKALKLEVLDNQNRVIFEGKGAEPKKDGAAEPEKKDDEERPDDVEKIELPTEPGLHRVVWTLRTKGAEAIPGARVDAGSPRTGVIVPPGAYTLRLTADGTVQSVRAVVQPDPRMKVNLAEQYELSLKVRDDITKLSQTVKQLRAVRKQLNDRNSLLAGEEKWESLRKSSKDVAKKLDDLEEKLHNPKAKITYDILAQKGGAKLYSQLTYVYANLLDADGPPTQGIKDVYDAHAGQLKKLVDEYDGVMKNELAKLNDEAKKLDLPTVLVPPVKPAKEAAR
jgi:hypothetical protein